MSNQSDDPNAWAIGFIAFAAFMLILVGFFHAIAGLIAIIDDEFYVVTPNYVFQFDVTTWGWINLLAGITAVLAGFALFTGAVWARLVGVLVAMGSAVTAFAWLPYNDVWGVVVILLNIAVIWALVTHGRDMVVEE